jgi:multimeric flavodoxin WrbA/putative sterol carrier protein
MMRLLKVLPGIILTLYITAGSMSAFRPPVVRSLSFIGFVLMGVAVLWRARAGGLSLIDGGFLIFMAINALAFWGFPQTLGQVMADFSTGVLYVILFLAVAAPAVLMNHYFTEHFAKQTTPEAVWETDIFKTVNRHMTWFWAGLFAASAFVTAIPFILDMPGNPYTGVLFQVVLPGILIGGVGIPLNKKYPLYYKRKMGVESEDLAGTSSAGAPAEGAGIETQYQQEKAMDDHLSVVAINGSPHGVVGNVSQMIQMIAPGLAEEGIHLEEITLTDKRIEYCVGCAICLQKGKCWRADDYAGIVDKLLAADGVILASPVYFGHVTAWMKTFIDRSLAYGHKPRRTWKPGLAVSASAGKGETETARYLARTLGVYGAFSIGTFTAIATNPGAFLGKELVEARAGDFARDLAKAIKEKRRYPAADENLSAFLFMKELVTREKDFMEDDYQYWQEKGLLEGFEAFIGQKFTPANYDPESRKEWLKEIIQEDKAKGKGPKAEGQEAETGRSSAAGQQTGKASAKTCLELLRMMPHGFKTDAGKDLTAVYQFEITGREEFTAHLKIEAGQCTFNEGPHGKPDVVIKSPADVWLAVSRGEMNGQTAFMSGKYKVQGNVGLIMKLKSLFS